MSEDIETFRDTFFEISVSSQSRNPKVSSQSWSRTTVFCVESRSRHCSDVSKAHRSKYVVVFNKK